MAFNNPHEPSKLLRSSCHSAQLKQMWKRMCSKKSRKRVEAKCVRGWMAHLLLKKSHRADVQAPLHRRRLSKVINPIIHSNRFPLHFVCRYFDRNFIYHRFLNVLYSSLVSPIPPVVQFSSMCSSVHHQRLHPSLSRTRVLQWIQLERHKERHVVLHSLYS